MVDSVNAELIYQTYAILGEGSIWDAENDLLYWVDIMRNQVYAFDPANRSNTGYDVKENVGTVVLRESGGLMLGLKNGFASLDLNTGKVEKLTDPESHIPNNRFNDGKCDPQGRFWAGTMAYDAANGAGSLYCMDTDFTVTKKIDGVSVSNGLVWNQAQSIFHYIDSLTYSVDAYDYEPESAAISNRRSIKSFPQNGRVPDGMAIDEEDFLWVAIFGEGKVIRIHPETGEAVHEISVPGAKQTTSCALGGKDLDELYITSARIGLSEEALKDQPNAGGLFRAKVPFKGVLSAKFKG